MTVEEAVKLVVSGGIVTPPDRSQSATPVAAKTNANKKHASKKAAAKKTVTKKTAAKKVASKTKGARQQA